MKNLPKDTQGARSSINQTPGCSVQGGFGKFHSERHTRCVKGDKMRPPPVLLSHPALLLGELGEKERGRLRLVGYSPGLTVPTLPLTCFC